jgi:hypothetical protein
MPNVPNLNLTYEPILIGSIETVTLTYKGKVLELKFPTKKLVRKLNSAPKTEDVFSSSMPLWAERISSASHSTQ